MQTPASKKTIDPAPAGDSGALKQLPPLLGVQISPSYVGVALYRCSYGLFALSLLLVFRPFILDDGLWLLVLLFCLCGLWCVYRQQIKHIPAGTLKFSDDHWRLDTAERKNSARPMRLAGEVLCWSWLIILPMREVTTGKARRLLIFKDALNKDDNARLRRWLRACLTPKT